MLVGTHLILTGDLYSTSCTVISSSNWVITFGFFGCKEDSHGSPGTSLEVQAIHWWKTTSNSGVLMEVGTPLILIGDLCSTFCTLISSSKWVISFGFFWMQTRLTIYRHLPSPPPSHTFRTPFAHHQILSQTPHTSEPYRRQRPPPLLRTTTWLSFLAVVNVALPRRRHRPTTSPCLRVSAVNVSHTYACSLGNLKLKTFWGCWPFLAVWEIWNWKLFGGVGLFRINCHVALVFKLHMMPHKT